MNDELGLDVAQDTRSLPELGHRNYWYPLIESSRVGQKPVAVRVLGEDIVLFRSGGKLGALADRCPHRGARLSDGRTLFPGTLSCGYHGWTFNSEGRCVAAVLEGPESRLPPKVHTRAYPVAERFGTIWAFIGDQDPPPLDEDLPPEIKKPGAVIYSYFEEWDCTWRNVTENFADSLHTIYVHRGSLLMLFDKVPAWGSLAFKPLPDGKGISIKGSSSMTGDYRGLGKYPARSWWRFHASKKLASGYDLRMPGYIVITRATPWLNFPTVSLQWPVPVDSNRTSMYTMWLTNPGTFRERLLHRLWYVGVFQHLLHGFVDQDRRIIEHQTYRDPEKLSASDVAVIQWRRTAYQLARRGPEAPEVPPVAGAKPVPVEA
jgi:phenylpropionate dioxygenase-like ring-hydroxylating dioxygenase large terminal subunit